MPLGVLTQDGGMGGEGSTMQLSSVADPMVFLHAQVSPEVYPGRC